MADCSYARCVQERRFIKRELQKWTKSMVYIVGLERVAEELMGRRKWKLYQDVLTSSTHHQPHYQQSQQQQQLSPTDHHQANTASATAAQPDTNLAVNNISTVAVDLDCVPTAKNNGQLLGHLKGNLDKVGALSDKEEAQPPAAHCIKIDKEIKIENEAIESPSSAKEDNLKKNGEENPNSHNLNHPVDWKPQDKCYFCVDGKLLAVNDRGELVPESGSGNTEPELLTTTPIDSDSDSSESEIGNPNLPNATSRAVKELLRNPNMTSLESVMAQYAAVASMHGLPAMPGLAPFYPGLWYSPFTQNLQDNAESSSSTNQKQSTNSDNASPVPNAEQPLDLSAKSSSSSSSSLDQKNIFKAKPRMTAISGRRTYTEDELQNALQDILSGKLGTRRAAVLYGIPRSTLRNKVYKLAMEQKREANINPILVAPVLNDLDEDDKESGAEDEKELEKTLHGLPSEDILRITATQSLALQNIGKYYQNHNQDGPSDMATPPPKQSPIPSKSQTPTLQNPLLDPNMFSLLLSGSLGALSGLGAKSDETPPAAAMAELFRNFLLQHELLKSSEGRVVKSETPETASLESTGRSGSDVNDTNDDPSVILKIPSFKPIVGPSGVSLPGAPLSLSTAISNNKNGDTAPNSQPTATTPVLSRSPHQSQQHSLLGMPSPNLHPSSDSQSPPIPNLGKVSIRDVIAQSISKNFQPNLMEPVKKKHPQPESGPSMLDYYKTYPSISVKKDLGAEMNRFGSGSSLLGGSSVMNASLNNTGTGGKGTRPKRGKYRNYDRDSLVEAVRAVQRGEMSVHRAGSYYGVPHSTLEYKVKERHLMRPRKREPKPQPVDDRGTNSSSSPVTNTKSSDIPSSSNAVRSALDKGKLVSPASAKPPLKTPPFSSTSSPNGMKMPFVDPAMAAQLQYSPHLFWPHPPNFSGMPMDFARTSGSSSSTTFPPNTPDTFFASQMMQRFQEEGAHRKTNSTNSTSSHNSNSMAKLAGNSINNSGKPGQQLSNSFVPKSARELAESLYDGTNVNGSFLDGIIRHSLDRKPGDIPQGALLDQLVKSNLPLSSKLLGDEGSKTSMLGSVGSLKRGASPMNFPTEIKRERDSPPSEPSLVAQPVLGLNSRKRGSEGNDNGPLVDSLLKLREGLQERPTEDFNGSNNKEVDQKPKNLLMASDNDNEDSS